MNMNPPFHPQLHSCEHCRNLVLDRGEKDLAWLQNIATRLGLPIHSEAWLRFHLTEKLNDNNGSVIVFDVSGEDGKHAAETGCLFFQKLLEGYEGNYSPRKLLGAKIYTPKRLPDGKTMGRPSIYFVELCISDSVVIDEEHKGELIEIKYLPQARSCEFVVLWSPSISNVQNAISTRQINMTPSSDRTFDLVTSWLRECSQHHDGCGKPSGEFAPTRVLRIEDVDDGIGIRLYKTNPARVEPFAALSYCWGKNNHSTTTTDTIEENMRGIKFESLPAAIKDAVVVTKRLGLRNLWVDALCIIQDSPEDKRYEIATMQSVYSQATLTIAASRSNSSGESFLADRSSIIFTELMSKEPNGAHGTAVIFPMCEMAPEPLNTRGWALQERLLSPRYLEYGSLQTRWLCSRIFDFPKYSVADSLLYFDQSESMIVDKCNNHIAALLCSASNQSGTAVNEHKSAEALQYWGKIVSYYTHRNLSEPGDRLPALSGVAARIGKLLNSEYCAGLWRFRLAQDLVSWFRREPGHWKSFTLCKRPSQYLGPSWSWAGVYFPIDLEVSSYKIHKSFNILHCKFEFRSSNQNEAFGAVESGVLTVQCRLRQAHMVRKNGCSGYQSADYELKPDSPNQVKAERAITEIRFTPDYVEEKLAPENDVGPISVFLMIVTDEYKGVVLRKIASGRYSRVGSFYNPWGFGFGRKDWPGEQFKKWINEAEEKIIEII